MKKALIVSPYLDHLGGGERYMLSVASVLGSLDYEIYFAWDNMEEITKLSVMLDLDLQNAHLDPKVKDLYFQGNPLKMYRATKSYDLVVYLSDGSIPLLGGKHNILHLQVPFHGVNGKSWKNTIKKRFIDHVIVNSQFTKGIIDQEFGLNSTILYPPVSPITCSSPKQNIILSVGRFEPSLNAKKQDALIQAFRLFSSQYPTWRLALAGGSTSDEWQSTLHKLAEGLEVDFYPNISHSDLCDLYAKSRIYWHAAGYGVDENKNPELTEHFGISTVEAVSASCIPLVVPYGGQREIITSPDLQWQTIEELVHKTQSIIDSSDPSSYLTAIQIDDYKLDTFAKNLQKLLI
jgi:glycosyltransferase involved in cell wall biosynthesis